jgi:hypothetical protein
MSSWEHAPEKGWQIVNRRTGDVVFESDDPQAVVDEGHRLAQEAEAEAAKTGLPPVPYGFEGDPYELGVMQELDHKGNVVRGPKQHRRPRGK